jgi:hypothetical protein
MVSPNLGMCIAFVIGALLLVMHLVFSVNAVLCQDGLAECGCGFGWDLDN